jgi:hypothetical protein
MPIDWSKGRLDESYYTEPDFLRDRVVSGVVGMAAMQLWVNGVFEPGILYLLGSHNYAVFNFGGIVSANLKENIYRYPSNLEGFVREALEDYGCRGLVPATDEALMLLLLKLRLPAYDSLKVSGETNVRTKASEQRLVPELERRRAEMAGRSYPVFHKGA